MFFPRPHALALATGLVVSGAWAQLQPSTALQPLPRGDAARDLPIVLQADSLQSRPDLKTEAAGKVEFRRGGLVLRADRLSYDNPDDLAVARGNVRVSRDGLVWTGPEVQLHVQRFEGFFLQPEFELTLVGAGGRAERVEFIDASRSRAIKADYTSCPRDDGQALAWVLRADRVTLDLDANEGVAEGAVLRFQGVPILALPRLSFPLSDARRSGWLPPTLNSDNRSGVELSVPWYWNIAPNRDATFTPRILTRRGFGLDSEFRYLDPRYEGNLQLDWLPDDRVARRERHLLQWTHDGRVFGSSSARFFFDGVRVSDDLWWKDFPNARRTLSARLLPLRSGIEQPFAWGRGDGLVYARVQQWQVLQGSDSVVVSPYERTPQIGARWRGDAAGFEFAAESEFNRFTLPSGDDARAGRLGGDRLHLLAHASRPFREPGWWVVPRVAVNAASYDDVVVSPGVTRHASRVIPSFSLDTGVEFERATTFFGRPFTQTLEPRLLYLRTAYRAQSQLPNYDAAAKDFNFASIYSDNQFSGIDRVSDANLVTAGVTTRFIDAATGAEALRLGVVQRFLLRGQRVTAQPDGTPDGPPLDDRLSDLLFLGSTNLVKAWSLDASVQYSPDIHRSVRSVVGARYAPGPFRTMSITYRLARGLTEQVELGWQWPIYGTPRESSSRLASNIAASGQCTGTWYAVGRVNYSMKDSRITDSIVGAEYDAGCWIGRIVSERLSTGRSQATTRFMLQLELVGLSRLGSNPLRVLKDNIPGYRLLREDRRGEDSNAARVYD